MSEEFKSTNKEGKVTRVSTCEYFYDVPDAFLWWNLPYHEALQLRRDLCEKLLTQLNTTHWLHRDSERINRLLGAMKDIDKQLADKPKE